MANKQKSLYVFEPQGSLVIQEMDIPEPGPGELLVEIHATALNPVDWKNHATGWLLKGFPAVLGADAAGIVKRIGEGVTGFSVGDRVLHQGYFDNRNATFQQYTIVPAEITAKIPPNLTFDQAATIPLTVATAALGLYNKKGSNGAGLVAPWQEGGRGKYAGQPILIIGGASSVGQHVIQFAKLSGFSPIITTASASNEALLKSLGATHVLDRHAVPLSALAEQVKTITSEPIKIVFDTISLLETQNAAYDILASGGIFLVLLPFCVEESKRTDSKELVEVFGNVHVPNQREVGVSLYKKLTELLASGDIKPNNVEVLPNGLAGIPAGLEKLKAGVSASKLVARPQETA